MWPRGGPIFGVNLIILFLYDDTRGVQYVMKTARYIPKFYIYTLHNYFS